MSRKATGQIKDRNGRKQAFLRGECLGTYATQQEAEDAIAAAQSLADGEQPDTLAVYGEAWMEAREADGDVRGIEEEWSLWVNHVEPAPFYDRPGKQVKPGDVTKYLLVLSRKPKVQITRTKAGIVRKQLDTTLSQGVVAKALRLMRQAFQAMVDDGLMDTNPALGAKMPKMARVQEEAEEWSFLFVEEIVALFNAIEAIVPKDTSRLKPKTLARLEQRRCFYRAVYALAIYGGLRQGEIFGLHWDDIHFEARGIGDRSNSLRVRRTRDMGRAPKSESSKRWVPMLPPLRAALEAWRRHGGVLKATGKVFPADGAAGQGNKPKQLGGYFSESYDAGWERRFCKLATTRDYVTFHDLRHTCASHLIMGTWGLPLTPFEVAEWLGHADVKTTKRYMHLAPNSLEELVRTMGRGATKAEAVRRAELTRRMMQYGKR